METRYTWLPDQTLPLPMQQEELRNIALRRALQQQPGETQQEPASIAAALTGLALSGGGIRSATFGLGVLEALKEQDRLRAIDYLSTVSGGGYIGAWLSANCRRAAARRDALANHQVPAAIGGNRLYRDCYAQAATDWLSRAANWRESIAHLRRYSNYLSPQFGIFSADSWSMITTWVRNALLVQITVILFMATLLLLPRPLLWLFTAWPEMGNWRWTSVVLFVLAVSGVAANHWRLTTRRDVPQLQARNWKAGGLCAAACIAAAYGICYYADYSPFEDKRNSLMLSLLTAIPIVLAGLFLLPAGVRLAKPMLYLGRRMIPGWIATRVPRRIDYGQGLTQALVIVPLLLTGYCLAAVMWGLATGSHVASSMVELDSYGQFFLEGWRYWPFPLAITFVALWPLSYFSRVPDKRSLVAALLAPLPSMVVLHALLSFIMLLMHQWSQLPDQRNWQQGAWYALVWGPAMVLYAFSLTIVVQIGMLGRHSPEGVREWWSRLGAWLLVYGIAWMLVSVAAVFGPLWGLVALNSDWISLPALGGWAASTLGGLMAGNAGSTQGQKASAADTRFSTRILNGLAVVGPYIFIAGMCIGVAALLHLVMVYTASDVCCTLSGMERYYWIDMTFPSHMVILSTLAGLLIAASIFAWRVDINVFSLNSFYRGRLSRCYLGATRFVPRERTPQRFTLFDDDDDIPMPDLAGEGLTPTTGPQRAQAGPLHIVCCALNLGGSSDLSLHSRHAASYVLTPYRAGTGYYLRTDCGGYVPLGYRPITQYCGHSMQPTLAQATSVSGAAASPNMGYHTSPGTAFMLTMFNVRLGWWFPNPKLAHITRPSPSFSIRYLVKELFGAAEGRSNYLMISDGGHFENLAVYELVRRRCKVIIASDAECDGHYRFDGLGSLIRMCEVDFGVKITIDFTEIVPVTAAGSETPWARRRFAIGAIDYGDGERGVLIYLKAAMTGREDAAVLQYKAHHPRFPHESTGDQFYGEDQFESYRQLGYDIAHTVFAQVAMYPDLVTAAQALQQKYCGHRPHPHGPVTPPPQPPTSPPQPPRPHRAPVPELHIMQSPLTWQKVSQRIAPNTAAVNFRPVKRVHDFRFIRGSRHTH
ncbi:hypothetical protein GCM10027277_32660 [Pseudoduganella ginsengisoli]|uniref:PNPLA domain-containing protein n=1 Tax=Pseudoduganella ginsengisoli TaxID=1462440 RepID=A0A6L6Q7X7_9BURK|nr:patatin-like phospholipase family protein [Pseudoduganella ginsengisoli]MTW05606.1 hypothetical protein [Pseudoduganella ginsengisoli]